MNFEMKSRPGSEKSTSDRSSMARSPVATPDQTATPASTTIGLLDDTKHYMSPASARSLATRNEGDYDYDWQTPAFMRLLQNAKSAEVQCRTESSSLSCVEANFQRTLVIIRPDAMMYEDVVMRKIFESNFAIIQSRHIHLTPEQVSEIYVQHYGHPYFPHLVVSTSSGPVRAISVSGINAIYRWNQLIGPDKELKAEWFYPISMRRKFGLVDSIQEVLHGSENLRDSNFENRYIFPNNVLEPLEDKQDRVEDYLDLKVNATLLDGLTELCKVKPIDPVIYLADWLLVNNPYQPNLPPEIAHLPT